MKVVLQSLTIVSLAVLLAAPLAAQDEQRQQRRRQQQQRGGQNAVAQALSFLDRVELTAEQKTKIEELKAKHGPKITEAQKKVNAVMTPELRQKANEARRKAQADGKTGREAQEAVRAALGLSDEDSKKYDQAQAEVREATTALRQAVIAELTPEQREKANVNARGRARQRTSN